MTITEAVAYYKAARQEVHEAFDARDTTRLARALEVEAMWERICDRKRGWTPVPKTVLPSVLQPSRVLTLTMSEIQP
jgi:tRNA A37 N6-isopentenylltransferase MiaA